MKICNIFLVTCSNIYTGVVLTSPYSVFVEKIKRNNVHPCKPHSSLYKVGFKGMLTARTCYCNET